MFAGLRPARLGRSIAAFCGAGALILVACGGAEPSGPTTPEPEEPPEVAVALRFEPGPGDEHTGPSTMVSLVIIDKGGEKRVEVLSTEPGVCQHTYPRPLELARVRCGWLDESSILLVIRDDDTLVVRRGDSPREPTQELTRVTLPKNAHVTPIRPDTIPVQTEP